MAWASQVRAGAESTRTEGTLSFECQVCFEECQTRLALPPKTTINGDVIRKADCNHPVCQSCMASFVKARVEEQRVFGICCPIEGCSNPVLEQDVEKLVAEKALDPAVAEQMARLRRQDYTERLAQTCTQLGDSGIAGSMRLCPRCNVMIQRSSGCNSFGCICGHRFQYDKAPSVKDVQTALLAYQEDVSALHDLTPADATRRIVGACTSKGIKKYHHVMKKAATANMSLDLAELHEQARLQKPEAIKRLEELRRERRGEKVVQMLVAELACSSDEARVTVSKAKEGDESCKQMIREAKRLQAQKGEPVPCNQTNS